MLDTNTPSPRCAQTMCKGYFRTALSYLTAVHGEIAGVNELIGNCNSRHLLTSCAFDKVDMPLYIWSVLVFFLTTILFGGENQNPSADPREDDTNAKIGTPAMAKFNALVLIAQEMLTKSGAKGGDTAEGTRFEQSAESTAFPT